MCRTAGNRIVNSSRQKEPSCHAHEACRPGKLRQDEWTASTTERKQISVLQLINAYRFLGVRHANLDPLKHQEKPYIPELDPGYYGLTESDFDTVFGTGSLIGPARASLREILQILRQTYCGTIGVEYMYITDTEQKRWIQNRIEGPRAQPDSQRNTSAISWSGSMQRKGWRNICIRAMSGRNASRWKAAKA